MNALILLAPITTFIIYFHYGIPVWDWATKDYNSIGRFLWLMAYVIGGAFAVVMSGYVATYFLIG